MSFSENEKEDGDDEIMEGTAEEVLAVATPAPAVPAPAGAYLSQRELSYLRLLTAGLFKKPPPV